MGRGRSLAAIAEGEKYLRPEPCEVEHRFAPVFYYVPNALRDLPTFRDENSPVSCGNRIFSTAFSSAALLRGRERKKKKGKVRYHPLTRATKVSSQLFSSLVSASRIIFSSYTRI